MSDLARRLGALTVVIPLHENTRLAPGLVEGLRSAAAVIVVDNAGRDEESQLARGAGAQIVRLPENRGWGGALNAGASLAATPYLMFLKPDVTIESDAVAALLDAFEAAGERPAGPLFAVAPALRVDGRPLRLAENRLGRPSGAAAEGPSGLPGAAFLVRREMFERLEGFDRRLVLGLLEDDLFHRALARGWRLSLVAGARAERAPSRQRARAGERGGAWFKGYQTTASRLYLARKHGLRSPRWGEARRGLATALAGLIRLSWTRMAGGLAALRAALDDPAEPPQPRGEAGQSS